MRILLRTIDEQTLNRVCWYMDLSHEKSDYYQEVHKLLALFFQSINSGIIRTVKREIKSTMKRHIYTKLSHIRKIFTQVELHNDNTWKNLENNYQTLKEFCEKELSTCSFRDDIHIHIHIPNQCYEKYKSITAKITSKIDEFFLAQLEIFENNKNILNQYFHSLWSTFNFEYFKNESFANEMINDDLLSSFSFKTEVIRGENRVIVLTKTNSFLKVLFNKDNLISSFQYYTSSDSPVKSLYFHESDQVIVISIGNLVTWIHDRTKIFSFIGNYHNRAYFGIEKYSGQSSNSEYYYYYVGNYHNEQYQGAGVLITPAYLYIGNFIRGAKSGRCEIYFTQDNQLYIGEVKDNALNGKGIYVFAKSDIISYEGLFQEDSPRGDGIISFSEGDSLQGYLEGNARKGIWTYMKGKNIVGTIDYGNSEFESIKYNY